MRRQQREKKNNLSRVPNRVTVRAIEFRKPQNGDFGNFAPRTCRKRDFWGVRFNETSVLSVIPLRRRHAVIYA
jgi:hypothetical protein